MIFPNTHLSPAPSQPVQNALGGFREAVEGEFDFEGNPSVPLAGFQQAINWVLLQEGTARRQMVATMDGDDVVPCMMTARYWGMKELFEGVQGRIMEGVDEENW